jgi:hypothetical protein
MSAFVELYIDQGSNFNHVITMSDDVTNANLNVSGYNVSCQLRRSYYAANASGNITCTITDASNGEITLSMTAANTGNLRPGRHLFDVKVVNANNVVDRPIEGIVTVTPRITR